jgi:uncharacterized protein (TIGR03435 family)
MASTLAMRLLRTLAILAVPIAPAFAQAFDIASIRVNNTATDGRHHVYNDPSVSSFRTVNLSTKDLLQYAFDMPTSQILGGPAWLDSTLFDIDAKSDAAADTRLHSLPLPDARNEKHLMVQVLLADRFHLKVHFETRHLPIYSLVVANPKLGPKFQPSAVAGTTLDTSRNRLHIAGSDNTLALLARELAHVTGRVVENRTGITGRFDLKLRWTPDDAPTPLINGAPDPNPPPNLFSAIQEQLGLKLEPGKGPVQVLVIDHIEMPSEN